MQTCNPSFHPQRPCYSAVVRRSVAVSLRWPLSARRARAQSAADYVIGAQDVLTIQVFDQADLGGKYTVEADGTFSFPLIGRVKAGGLTLRELRGRAEEEAGGRLLQEPAGHRRGRAVPQPAGVRDGRGARARARCR